MSQIDPKKLCPIGHTVIVRVDKDEDLKVGKIVVPNTSSKKKVEGYDSGEVIAIGSTAWDYLDENDRLCEIGSKTIFKKYSGVDLTPLGGFSATKSIGEITEYRILNDEDILCLYNAKKSTKD